MILLLPQNYQPNETFFLITSKHCLKQGSSQNQYKVKYLLKRYIYSTESERNPQIQKCFHFLRKYRSETVSQQWDSKYNYDIQIKTMRFRTIQNNEIQSQLVTCIMALFIYQMHNYYLLHQVREKIIQCPV